MRKRFHVLNFRNKQNGYPDRKKTSNTNTTILIASAFQQKTIYYKSADFNLFGIFISAVSFFPSLL